MHWACLNNFYSQPLLDIDAMLPFMALITLLVFQLNTYIQVLFQSLVDYKLT